LEISKPCPIFVKDLTLIGNEKYSVKKKSKKVLDIWKKMFNFVKQFGEMVGMSVKPWFPNLEKKTKKIW